MVREFSVILGKPISRTQQRLSRRCAQAHDDPRLDQRNLGLEPRTARVDLRRIRFLMDPAFAPFLEFEVFDDVRDVYRSSVDAGLTQRAIKELASGTHKGKTLKIFIVTGLFADEYDAGSTRPNARHGLSSMQVEIAGFAPA